MTIKEKLLQVQKDLHAPKDQYNSFGKYAYKNAAAIEEKLKAFEAKLQFITLINNEVHCFGNKLFMKVTATMVDLESDGSISASSFVEIADELKGMSPGQVCGATESYGKKYALSNLFLIDDSDDLDVPTEEAKPQKKQEKKADSEEQRMLKAATDASQILYNGITLGDISKNHPDLFAQLVFSGDEKIQAACQVIADYKNKYGKAKK